MVCKINMRKGKIYLQLVLQCMDRVLDAFQEVRAEAGAARAIHRVPRLDEPGKVAEFCSARSEQIGQDLGLQRHPVTLPLGGLKSCSQHGRSHWPLLLILSKSNQLAALLRGENTPGWRLDGCGA